MTSAIYHILLALADEDRHGYAIMQHIETITEGRYSLGAGTLYRSIKKLLADGLIAEVEHDTDDERRRYYRLTESGRRQLQAETNRLAQIVRLAQKALSHG
jgi:DNA-binding PadR family transcriptional regulator